MTVVTAKRGHFRATDGVLTTLGTCHPGSRSLTITRALLLLDQKRARRTVTFTGHRRRSSHFPRSTVLRAFENLTLLGTRELRRTGVRLRHTTRSGSPTTTRVTESLLSWQGGGVLRGVRRCCGALTPQLAGCLITGNASCTATYRVIRRAFLGL